jgi:aminoglycoside phosphotransferase family enzyme/predicted kinase
MNRPLSELPGPELGLPEALLSPQAWGHDASQVELVETHISWVFLVGQLAYKVKKPVRLEFLDFSTAELRQHFCQEELRINRHFAPGLYLGLSRIVRTTEGLAVDRPGETVEYAVRMHRFDREQELDRLLGLDSVDAALLRRFGRKLAEQHAAAPVAGPGLDWASPKRNLRACRENFSTLRQLDRAEVLERVDQLETWTAQAFRRLRKLLRERLLAGRFRECHGDLHCANVVRHDDELWAFDALEFDPGLRWIDVASDLAFLSMDLRARGHAGLSSALLDGWLEGCGDFGALETLRFYEVYRACVRAKVAAIRLRQEPRNPAPLERELETYLAAAELATRPSQPLLVATTGLSGSGKSWLANRLLAPLDAVRVRSDVERKRLAGLSPGAAGGAGLYTPAMTRLTYSRLAELAPLALRGGYSVIVDAACLLAEERNALRRVAASAGVPFRLLWVTADAPLLRSRIDDRAAAANDPSEATVAVLERQRQFAQAPSTAELEDTVRVDTTAAVDVRHLAGMLRVPSARRATGCVP